MTPSNCRPLQRKLLVRNGQGCKAPVNNDTHTWAMKNTRVQAYDVGLNCTVPSFSSTSVGRAWSHGGGGESDLFGAGAPPFAFFDRAPDACGPSWPSTFALLGMQPMLVKCVCGRETESAPLRCKVSNKRGAPSES